MRHRRDRTPANACDFGGSYALSPHGVAPAIEDAWPALFWGGDRLAAIRKKIETPEFRPLYENLLAQADGVVERRPIMPIEPVGSRHDFYSPSTGEHLVFDPAGGDEHVDPWDQSVWRGPAFRRAWVLLAHERSYRLMRSLALLYALSGRERYARWACEVVALAVEMFRRYEIRQGGEGQAVYVYPLYDAQVLAMLAGASELLGGSDAYDHALHRRLGETVFAPVVPYQIRFAETRGAHNMVCYVDAALALAGRAFDRRDWIDSAMHHPTGGFYAMIDNGLPRDQADRCDGFWFEGTMFYHFYSLCPLLSMLPFADGDESPAIPPAEVRRRLTRMLMAPAEMADRRRRLPAFGDLLAPRAARLATFSHVYEAGAGLLDERQLHSVLAAIYGTNRPRDSLTALVFGPQRIDAEPLRSRSVHLPLAGIVFLRAGGLDVSLKAARQGGWHDHADKLAITLTAGGQPIIADLGSAGYSLEDFHSYCRYSYSHSMIVVDEQERQGPSQGELHCALEDAWAAGAILLADGAVRVERRVRLAAPLVLLEDLCEGKSEHVFNWMLHPYGSMSVAEAGREVAIDVPPLPDCASLKFFTNRRRRATSTAICLDWRVAEALWLRAWIWADCPFEYVVGRTPGNPMPDRRSTLMVRFRADSATVRAALEVHDGAPTLAAPPEGEFPLRAIAR